MLKKILIAIVIIIIVGVVAIKAIIKISEANMEDMISTEIIEPNLKNVEDGVYIGNYEGFPITVELEVTIHNHEIEQIKIIQHVNGQGGTAESIINEMINQQRIDVDSITGASYSSQAFKLAMMNALN